MIANQSIPVLMLVSIVLFSHSTNSLPVVKKKSLEKLITGLSSASSPPQVPPPPSPRVSASLSSPRQSASVRLSPSPLQAPAQTGIFHDSSHLISDVNGNKHEDNLQSKAVVKMRLVRDLQNSQGGRTVEDGLKKLGKRPMQNEYVSARSPSKHPRTTPLTSPPPSQDRHLHQEGGRGGEVGQQAVQEKNSVGNKVDPIEGVSRLERVKVEPGPVLITIPDSPPPKQRSAATPPARPPPSPAKPSLPNVPLLANHHTQAKGKQHHREMGEAEAPVEMQDTELQDLERFIKQHVKNQLVSKEDHYKIMDELIKKHPRPIKLEDHREFINKSELFHQNHIANIVETTLGPNKNDDLLKFRNSINTSWKKLEEDQKKRKLKEKIKFDIEDDRLKKLRNDSMYNKIKQLHPDLQHHLMLTHISKDYHQALIENHFKNEKGVDWIDQDSVKQQRLLQKIHQAMDLNDIYEFAISKARAHHDFTLAIHDAASRAVAGRAQQQQQQKVGEKSTDMKASTSNQPSTSQQSQQHLPKQGR